MKLYELHLKRSNFIVEFYVAMLPEANILKRVGLVGKY